MSEPLRRDGPQSGKYTDNTNVTQRRWRGPERHGGRDCAEPPGRTRTAATQASRGRPWQPPGGASAPRPPAPLAPRPPHSPAGRRHLRGSANSFSRSRKRHWRRDAPSRAFMRESLARSLRGYGSGGGPKGMRSRRPELNASWFVFFFSPAA